MEFTDTARMSSRNGNVSCRITVSGKNLSDESGQQAIEATMAQALRVIGLISMNLQVFSIKGNGSSNGVKSTQCLTVDGITARVIVYARYDKVSPYMTFMIIQDAPSALVESLLKRVLDITEHDIKQELASIVDDESPLVMMTGVMPGVSDFGNPQMTPSISPEDTPSARNEPEPRVGQYL